MSGLHIEQHQLFDSLPSRRHSAILTESKNILKAWAQSHQHNGRPDHNTVLLTTAELVALGFTYIAAIVPSGGELLAVNRYLAAHPVSYYGLWFVLQLRADGQVDQPNAEAGACDCNVQLVLQEIANCLYFDTYKKVTSTGINTFQVDLCWKHSKKLRGMSRNDVIAACQQLLGRVIELPMPQEYALFINMMFVPMLYAGVPSSKILINDVLSTEATHEPHGDPVTLKFQFVYI